MASSRKNKCFNDRADTLLRLTQQLSTLCDSPACIVIHNPHDAVNPWRIWPNDEPLFRNVLQLYKNSPKPRIRRPLMTKTKPIAGLSSLATSCTNQYSVDVLSSLSPAQEMMGLVTPMMENAVPETIEDYRIPIRHSISNITHVQDRQPPQEASAPTGEGDCVLAGNVPFLVGKEHLAENVVDDADHSTAIATAGRVCDGITLPCEWGENEMFEHDELLNFTDHVEENESSGLLNGTISSKLMLPTNGRTDDQENTVISAAGLCNELYSDEDMTIQPAAAAAAHQATTSSAVLNSMPPSVLLGSKRKAVEQVLSFSELMAPSSQRRRI